MINLNTFILIIFMTILGAFAGLFLKKASADLNFKNLLTNKNIYLGAVLYLISAFINIYLLKFLDYSIVLPLTSITYIWTMIISYFNLREKITLKKIVGIILIAIGSICISIT